MKPILIIPSGVLSTKEKDALDKEGYLTIVTDESEKIKFVGPDEQYKGITKDKLLEKALYIIANTSTNASGENMREWFSRIILFELLEVKSLK